MGEVLYKYMFALLLCSSSAAAEGVASDGVSGTGLTDRQCVSRADEAAQAQRSDPNYIRVIKGDYSRVIVFKDGWVTFACFPSNVTVLVYYASEGKARAKKDLEIYIDWFQ